MIRYGDLVKLTSKNQPQIKRGAWENFIIPIELKPDVREFGLLRSHLLVTRKDLGPGLGTLLRVYDFTVRSRRQQARDDAVSGRLPPYTVQEFLLSAEGGPLRDFQFTEDGILASAVSALLLWDTMHHLTYVICRSRWMGLHCYGYGQFRDGGTIRLTPAAASAAPLPGDSPEIRSYVSRLPTEVRSFVQRFSNILPQITDGELYDRCVTYVGDSSAISLNVRPPKLYS